jgi:Sulfotransferase family
MKFANWVFVTGAPRSGTTFAGKILSAPLSVDYIHEPFNPDCGMPGIAQRYLYIPPQGALADEYRASVQNLFDYRFTLKTGRYARDSTLRRVVKTIVGSRGPFYLRLAKLNPFHTAAIIKDPIGCLSTEFLATQFGVKPVVLIRHPVTFVASVRRLEWKTDLTNLREQPQLMQEYFADGDQSLHKDYTDPIAAAAVLWRALNKVLLQQASRHPEWKLLTHEALSQAPLDVFRGLYRDLDLPWSERIERLIARSTTHKRRSVSAPPVHAEPGGTAHRF